MAMSSRQTSQPPEQLSTMFAFTWRLHDFSKQTGRTYSPKFSGHPLRSLKWQFIIYPDSDRPEAKGYISVYLKLCDEDEDRGVFECNSLSVSYRIGLIDSENKLVHADDFEGEDDFIESEVHAWGWSKFLPRVLLDSEKLLTNDMLTLRCEITYTQETIFQLLPLMDTPIPHLNLVTDISKLFGDTETTDITIVVRSKRLAAHKLVLKARSDVFRVMLTTKLTLDKNKDVIEIDEFEFEVVKAMVFFMYTGCVPRLTQVALELMKAAEKYNLMDLKKICEENLCVNLLLVPEEALSILVDAILFNATNLKAKVGKYIAQNIEAVKQSETWAELLPTPISQLVMSDIMNNIDANRKPPPS